MKIKLDDGIIEKTLNNPTVKKGITNIDNFISNQMTVTAVTIIIVIIILWIIYSYISTIINSTLYKSNKMYKFIAKLSGLIILLSIIFSIYIKNKNSIEKIMFNFKSLSLPIKSSIFLIILILLTVFIVKRLFKYLNIKKYLKKYEGQRIKLDKKNQLDQYFVFKSKLHYLTIGAAKVCERYALELQHLNKEEGIILVKPDLQGSVYNALQMEKILDKLNINKISGRGLE